MFLQFYSGCIHVFVFATNDFLLDRTFKILVIPKLVGCQSLQMKALTFILYKIFPFKITFKI